MNGSRASQTSSRRGVRNIQRGRRGFLGMMGGTGAALLAAACGGSNNKANSAATTVATRAAATTAATSAATATAAGTVAVARATTPAAPVKVSTVTYFGADVAPEEVAWHKKFDADFATAFPQYRAEDSEYASNTDFYPKLQTALATNSPPDYIFRDNKGQDLVTLWDLGQLLPVNDTLNEIYKSVIAKDQFLSVAVDRFTLASGDVIGVPFTTSPYVMWYRQDLLQAAGLTAPAGHWDWNFLLQAVKALHRPPAVYGIGIPVGRSSAVENHLGAFVMNNGGHFVSQDLKDVLFDSPEVREVLDLYRELGQYIPPGANTWTSADQLNAIIQGNVAMGMYQGRVFSNLVTMNPSLIGKMSNTLVPYNKQPSNFGGYSAHGVLKGAKNPQGAKDMIKFSMTKAEFIEWILVNPGQSNPVITSFGTDPSYIGSNTLKAFDPKLVATMTEAEKGQIDFVKEGPAWKPNVKAGTLSGSLFLAEVLQKVIIGKESSQSVATFGAQQIAGIMKG